MSGRFYAVNLRKTQLQNRDFLMGTEQDSRNYRTQWAACFESALKSGFAFALQSSTILSTGVVYVT